MRNYFYIPVLFILIGTLSCFSQSSSIVNQLLESNQLSILSAITNKAPLPSGSLNIAQINQVGLNNEATVFVAAKRSAIYVDQTGSDNLIDVAYNVYEVSADLLQNGYNNTITETVNDPLGSVNSNVTQIGNNLEVNKIGANTISNKLEINMLGSDKTITIISF